MLHLNSKIPREVTVACSGGPDSMAVLHFLNNTGKRSVTALFVNHGTLFSEECQEFVRGYCESLGVKFVSVRLNNDKLSTASWEEHWSQERNKIFQDWPTPVITGHNLNDAAEWWVMTSLRGSPRLMPIVNQNVYRTFLYNSKEQLVEWCKRHGVPYKLDPTNLDGSNDRSKLRAVWSGLLNVNPGLLTTIRNLYQN